MLKRNLFLRVIHGLTEQLRHSPDQGAQSTGRLSSDRDDSARICSCIPALIHTFIQQIVSARSPGSEDTVNESGFPHGASVLVAPAVTEPRQGALKR